jgi:hypothetical protein
MAAVTSAFTTAANQVWASPTWSADDPSYKLNTQLTAWITAINDPAVIEMVANPGSATARGSSDAVRWLLRARAAGDTGSDYGINFARRNSGSGGDTFASGFYYGRTPGSAVNGYGSLNLVDSSAMDGQLGVARSHFTAYEATGALPWFVYSTTQSANSGTIMMLARLSTDAMKAGSYYPASGVGKWLHYVSSSNFGSDAYLYTPQSRNTAPYIGFPNGGSALRRVLAPSDTYGANYFFELSGIYGDSHYLGRASSDILVSSQNTGNWGDTVTISGVTYTCQRVSSSNVPAIWVKTS